MTESELPFTVRAISDYKKSDKSGLSFKRGQVILVTDINKELSTYCGSYNKKEGWFPNYYVRQDDTLSNDEKQMISKLRRHARSKSMDLSRSNGSAKQLLKREGINTADTIITSVPVSEKSIDEKARKKEEERLKKEQEKQHEKQKKEEERQRKEADKLKKEEEKRLKKEEEKKAKEDEKEKKKEQKGRKLDRRAMMMKMKVPGSAAERSPNPDPLVVETIMYLEQPRCLTTEGLFRISGALFAIQDLTKQYQEGKKVDLTKILDPHLVAGVLKLYFRELDEPLLMYDLYDAWIAAMNTGTTEAHIKYCRRVIDLMPPKNRATLKLLLQLLYKVSEHSDVNKMTVQNLAIVFAPTLLRPRDNPMRALIDAAKANALICLLITEHKKIFEAETPPVLSTSDTSSSSSSSTASTSTSSTSPTTALSATPNDAAFERIFMRASFLTAKRSFTMSREDLKMLMLNKAKRSGTDTSATYSSPLAASAKAGEAAARWTAATAPSGGSAEKFPRRAAPLLQTTRTPAPAESEPADTVAATAETVTNEEVMWHVEKLETLVRDGKVAEMESILETLPLALREKVQDVMMQRIDATLEMRPERVDEPTVQDEQPPQPPPREGYQDDVYAQEYYNYYYGGEGSEAYYGSEASHEGSSGVLADESYDTGYYGNNDFYTDGVNYYYYSYEDNQWHQYDPNAVATDQSDSSVSLEDSNSTSSIVVEEASMASTRSEKLRRLSNPKTSVSQMKAEASGENVSQEN